MIRPTLFALVVLATSVAADAQFPRGLDVVELVAAAGLDEASVAAVTDAKR